MSRRYRRFRKQRDGEGGVPTDSFSDIAFLLIIFFMIATTLVKTKGFMTDLPAGKENQNVKNEEKVPHINLSGDIIFYNSEQVDLVKLRDILFDLKLWEKDADNKRIVKLEAQPNVIYKQYFPVWAAVVRAGGVVALVEPDE